MESISSGDYDRDDERDGWWRTPLGSPTSFRSRHATPNRRSDSNTMRNSEDLENQDIIMMQEMHLAIKEAIWVVKLQTMSTKRTNMVTHTTNE